MKNLRYNKVFINGVIALLICSLMSAAFIIPSIIFKIQYDNLISDMKSIEATIVDIDLDVSVRGPYKQEIYITYEVDGVFYNRELSTDTKIEFDAGTGTNYSIGDKLDIFYNPQNPNEIATSLSANVSYFYLSIGLIVFTLVMAGLVFLLKNRRKFLVTEEEFKIENSKQKNSELMNINGKKIRWQYFNAYIYLLISFMPAVFVVILGQEFKKGSFDIWNYIVEMTDEIPGILVIYLITIGPLIILSILNRFFW